MKQNANIVLIILITALIAACQAEPQTKFYVGINGPDTAHLTLNIIDGSFYGKYEVRKRSYTDRKGDIRGKIKGDTLLGDYHYFPYGGGTKKRIPIAFLQKDNELLMGKGVVSSYMGIPFFVSNIPIDYEDPEFRLVKND